MTTRQDTGAEPVATSEVAAGEVERGAVVSTGAWVALGDEHPLHRLERAAAEYAKATIGSRGSDLRAANLTGTRGARAGVLAARARTRKIDASMRLQAAAMLFAAWATERKATP